MTDSFNSGADGVMRGPGLSELAHSAVGALGPEAGVLVDLDPALFGRALAHAAVAAAAKPAPSAAVGVKCAVGLSRATLAAASRLLGRGTPGPIPPDGVDRRFADPAWEDNPVFFWLCQSHLVFRRLAEDLVAGGELDTRRREKAAFAVSLLADALVQCPVVSVHA